MSTTPKALLDCPACHAPQGHRHSPNCIVVIGLNPEASTTKTVQTFTEIVEEFEKEYFEKRKSKISRKIW